MTMKSEVQGGNMHYWLTCDQAGCATAQPDVAISIPFCLTTAAGMGWRTDPASKKDFCSDHVASAETSIGHAFVHPDQVPRS
jgi:hypothetical protein